MCTEFNRSVVGERVAAMRNDRSRFNLAKLQAGERRRLTEIDRQIDMRAYTYAPADRTKQQMARRWLTNAALIAETGSTQENSK